MSESKTCPRCGQQTDAPFHTCAFASAADSREYLKLQTELAQIKAERDELKHKLTNRPAVIELEQVKSERDALVEASRDYIQWRCTGCGTVGSWEEWKSLVRPGSHLCDTCAIDSGKANAKLVPHYTLAQRIEGKDSND